MPQLPIVEIESSIESRLHIELFSRNCFESVILSVLNMVCQESFKNQTFIFIFDIVVSNNVMYFVLWFKRRSRFILSQKELEHIFQP